MNKTGANQSGISRSSLAIMTTAPRVMGRRAIDGSCATLRGAGAQTARPDVFEFNEEASLGVRGARLCGKDACARHKASLVSTTPSHEHPELSGV